MNIANYADDLILSCPNAHKNASTDGTELRVIRPKLARQRFVDDGHRLRTGLVALAELAPTAQRNAERAEVIRHNELDHAQWALIELAQRSVGWLYRHDRKSRHRQR